MIFIVQIAPPDKSFAYQVKGPMFSCCNRLKCALTYHLSTLSQFILKYVCDTP